MTGFWVKYLVAGVILTGIIFFSSIVTFNIVVNKIPHPGFAKQLPPESTSGFNYSLKYSNKVAADDPARKHILTENQAWEYAWPFYHHNQRMTIFLPMEKRSLGLFRFTDQKNDQYTVWVFNVIQNDHRTFFITGFQRGGTITIDAYSGTILSFDEVS